MASCRCGVAFAACCCLRRGDLLLLTGLGTAGPRGLPSSGDGGGSEKSLERGRRVLSTVAAVAPILLVIAVTAGAITGVSGAGGFHVEGQSLAMPNSDCGAVWRRVTSFNGGRPFYR